MASELAEEKRYERQELGAAVDAARVSVRYNSNVNYYTAPSLGGRAGDML